MDSFLEAKKRYSCAQAALFSAQSELERSMESLYSEFMALEGVKEGESYEVETDTKKITGVFRVSRISGILSLRLFAYKRDGTVSSKPVDLYFGEAPELSWDSAGVKSVVPSSPPEDIEIDPTPEQRAKLDNSLRIFTEACKWVSKNVVENQAVPSYRRDYLARKYADDLQELFGIRGGMLYLVCSRVSKEFAQGGGKVPTFAGLGYNALLSTFAVRTVELYTPDSSIKVSLAGVPKCRRWDKMMVKTDLILGESREGIEITDEHISKAGTIVTIDRVRLSERKYSVRESDGTEWCDSLFDFSYVDGGGNNG